MERGKPVGVSLSRSRKEVILDKANTGKDNGASKSLIVMIRITD